MDRKSELKKGTEISEDGQLQPTGILKVDRLTVSSYMPEAIKQNGACLALGFLFARMEKKPYELEYMLLRHEGERIFSEPLVYRDERKIVLKKIADDVQRFMHGKLGSVYIQMKEKNEQKEEKIEKQFGISFWNLDYDSRFFNVAYRIDGERSINERHLSRVISQVYCAFVNGYKDIMEKMMVPYISYADDTETE